MSDRFEHLEDPVVGERVQLGETSKGLKIRVAPTDRFREMSAMITFRYGSTDLGFDVAGSRHSSPEGVAHYLEHKLFEDDELHVFERFGQRGAQVNAMTGFGRTTYYFNATTSLEENLQDLLHLVSNAHLTDENVEKERGIIAQELRMYEDSPEYRGFFDLLRCFYREHPVRNPVGGTVESIQGIDVAELTACYDAYYRCGNAALAVAGPVDSDAVFELAEACALRAGEAPVSRCPEDLGPVQATSHERAMEIARPRVLLGFKERSLVEDVSARVTRDLVTRIWLDHVFGAASDVREELHRKGLVDDSLSASYTGDRAFGFAVLACESDEPDRAVDALRGALKAPCTIEESDLERVRRKMLGRYVRTFESVQPVAMGHGDEALEGLAPFGAVERMRSVTVDDVRARHAELCRDDSFASVVVRAD